MKQKLKLLVSIVLGNALIAFAVCAFVVPNNFMLGGVNGMALALQHWVGLPLSVWTAILNAILFALGWICMGKQFAANTLLSTVVYPVIMAVFEQFPLGSLFSEDPLTCVVFCSICVGLGIGIVLREGGSTGGMDIPPCILQKYNGIPVGISLAAFDTAIVVTQVLIHGLDGVLYSLLIIFLISAIVNRTVVGGEKKVQIIVISPEYDAIRKHILETLDSGVTMLDIETGYEENSQKAVFCIVYAKKYPAVRDAVLRFDPKAFIVTSDVKNVNGVGYTLSRRSNEIT